jgi:hypothetical protein
VLSFNKHLMGQISAQHKFEHNLPCHTIAMSLELLRTLSYPPTWAKPTQDLHHQALTKPISQFFAAHL